tara:strand:- start:665 stop:1075 length:411 start_codon:yes stop_codon:yes gene_type:complete
MTVSESQASKWQKVQTKANGLPQSTIKEDGTKTLWLVTVVSDAYPQNNRTGWKVKPDPQGDDFTFFNIYPEDYSLIPQINEARESGEEIPVVINHLGRAILMRPEDSNPNHPKAVKRAALLAAGKIDEHGNEVKAD